VSSFGRSGSTGQSTGGRTFDGHRVLRVITVDAERGGGR
jgi:hypothetical protein